MNIIRRKMLKTKLLCDCDIYLFYDDNSMNLACQDSNWNIDYGDLYHVIPRRVLYIYTHGDFDTIKMGNKEVSEIVGIGDILGCNWYGYKLWPENVRHVLNRA